MTHTAQLSALLLLACGAGCILDKQNIGVTITSPAIDDSGSSTAGDEDPTTEGGSSSTGAGSSTTTGVSSTTTGEEPMACEAAGPGGEHPQEGPWTTVVDAHPFGPEIKTITVGGREFLDNFANRGDVEVLFDLDVPAITIEMRAYDFSDTLTFHGDDINPGTLQRLRLWAYNTGGTPQKPSSLPAEDDCTLGAWQDGCEIRVYYDGVTQPVRSGVDLRVHLPRSYRGGLVVETDDNMHEPTYPRRSDVVVDDLCGDGDIELAQGSARVKLCDALTPAPTCSPEQISACDNFKDGMGQDAAWSPDCPCAPERYGQLKIQSRKPHAADITVDIPDTTWLNVIASNDSPDKPHDCKPTLEACTAATSCTPAQNTEYSVSGEFNRPSPAAIAGGGFDISVLSAGCGPVESYASPEDWCAQGEPTEVEHGHVRVCTDCL